MPHQEKRRSLIGQRQADGRPSVRPTAGAETRAERVSLKDRDI